MEGRHILTVGVLVWIAYELSKRAAAAGFASPASSSPLPPNCSSGFSDQQWGVVDLLREDALPGEPAAHCL
jgi:hypothetical protein